MESDEELVRRSNDDRPAFELLVRRHSEAIHAYLFRRAPQAADDLLSEVWLTAFSRRTVFEPGRGTFRGWLFGIARVHMLAYHRQASARVGSSHDATSNDGEWEAVDARLDAALLAPEIRSAIRDLSAVERELLLLTAWQELTPSEAATLLGISPEAARSRLHRARLHVRERLASLETA